MNRFSFSGHETFICKQFWLKKGYDYLQNKLNFSDKNAVVHLGVGKNMVSSIQFWMKAFGLLEEDGKTPNVLASLIFDDNGYDPYIENMGTVWLLHYLLVSTKKSSLYNLIFNDFRKERQEFTKDNLFQFVKRQCEDAEFTVNENTLNADIGVFAKSYAQPDVLEKLEVEESFTGLLIDLDLVKKEWRQGIADEKAKEYFILSNEYRPELPYYNVLYVILDMLNNLQKGNSISFRQLQSERNSPGLVFALSNEGLYDKIKDITQGYPQVIFTDTAGVQTLQFKFPLTKEEVLHDYYRS